MKKLTQEEFIRRAKEIHGNRYNYSKSIYTGYENKLCISCEKHGEFWQMPSTHLHGGGCPMCSAEQVGQRRFLGKEKFVDKATQIHGDKYDYSLVEYKGSFIKVAIVCPKHGIFYQRPHEHLSGNGCPLCKKEKLVKINTMTQEEFVQNSEKVYGNKYDYSKVNYVNCQTKVCIICPIHGEFWQTPTTHLKGTIGCRKCRDDKLKSCNAKPPLTTEEFIRRARLVHGDKYDYQKSNYTNSKAKICITCQKHGDFWQDAGGHLHGAGCPKCKRSLGEESVEGFLKEHNIEYLPQYCIKNENLFCFNERFLVDFYLPDYNTFIEFNGEQHYKPIKWYGGQVKFEQQQERDYALRQYCKEHNIKLIEIPYTEFNNIESVLTKELLT